MNSKKYVFPALIIMVVAVLFTGCAYNPGDTGTTQVVEINRVQDTYYLVNIDLTRESHFETGKQYAEQIVAHVPDYEARIDSFINYMLGLLQQAVDIDLAELVTRAGNLKPNIPQEYMEEINGMQSVFSYDKDIAGDGRLSQNEFLVFNLFGDIARPTRCSASAVFGDSSVTGHTVLGRNLDWDELPNSELWPIQAVIIMENDDKSMASIGYLGEMAFISAFNNDHIFGAMLDSDTGAPYPSTAGKRSYTMDLRYALENETTLEGVAGYMKDKDYPFNHLVFLADTDSAQVLENDIDSPARGLRTATSELKPGMTWSHPNAIVAVNCFLLPGNEDNIIGNNRARWDSYTSFYNDFLAEGKMGMEEVMQIESYPGTDGKGTSGAIFRSRDHAPTIQSIIMRMDTLETSIYFCPVGPPPYEPATYIPVFTESPFAE
jgi:hypothetical protein